MRLHRVKYGSHGLDRIIWLDEVIIHIGMGLNISRLDRLVITHMHVLDHMLT